MNRNSVFTGLLLIMAGIIVLLLNLGYGSWSMIWQIWRLWPLILIIIGIRILWRGPSSQWFSFGVLFLLGAGIIALMLINPKNDIWPGKAGLNTITNDLVVNRAAYPEVTSGNAKINFGGGRLTLNSDTEHWAEGLFGGFEARTAVKNLNNQLLVTMKQSGHFSRRWRRHRDWDESANWDNNNRSNRDFHWDLRLSPDLDWNIDLNTGASKAEVNLSNLRVKELDLKMGAGDLTLTFGDQRIDSVVKINSGASKIKVIVPKGLGVKVKTSGALVHTNLGSQGWIYNNHEYRSPEYDQSANQLMIDLNMGIGDFELVVQ